MAFGVIIPLESMENRTVSFSHQLCNPDRSVALRSYAKISPTSATKSVGSSTHEGSVVSSTIMVIVAVQK